MARRLIASVILLLVLPETVPAAEPAEQIDPERQIDFERDVIPVLTKFGCNAGACHGNPRHD